MKNTPRLRKIYEKTDGYCHLCHKKLRFSSYGVHGGNGAWNIEHSVAKYNGGTDNLHNLFPACISCNAEKGTQHTKTIRKKKGVTRAPYSRKKKAQIREDNIISGGIVGGVVGLLFGPVGVLTGGVLGALIGEGNSPHK